MDAKLMQNSRVEAIFYIKVNIIYSMFPRGHTGFLMLIYTIAVKFSGSVSIPILGIGLPIAVAMSISPDIDMSDRLILSKIEHRGITHTIWFTFLVTLISYVSLALSGYIISLDEESIKFLTFAVFIGYTSHIVLDMVNEQGIRPIYTRGHLPTVMRLRLPLVESDNIRANNILFILGTLVYLSIIILPSILSITNI